MASTSPLGPRVVTVGEGSLRPLMETLAPPVVAVIVTCDPGPWFAETLRAFAAQEYPELSVLVLDAGSAEDPTAVVAAELPGAFVRLLGVNRGFGASANEALTMVEGASYFLFCHDDVAPAPDAVHLLVEESYRSNAGVVAPKLVSWDDPERLLHVGMAVDKGGAVVDRVEPGEVDHGQHDAVRDVFLAPGGCTLVRADLFAELGGFDPDIFAMGEDLDLCWRAQIAGARVLVAPQARVRHLEVLASGRRPLPDSVLVDLPVGHDCGSTHDRPTGLVEADVAPADHVDPDPVPADSVPADAAVAVPAGSSAVILQSLQRRHELHVVLKSYGRFHLSRVLPQLIALASAEYGIARASGHGDRAAAVAHAWRWNFVRRRAIRSERVEVRAHRLLDDAEVRRLQLHGSARLNAYLRRAVNQGLKAAHLGAESDVGEGEAARDSAHRRRIRADAVSLRVVAWAVAVVVLVFGTRQLLGSGFPYVGQLLPMPSAGTLLHRFLSGWQPTGVGTTDPTSPATGILGVAGMVLFGGVGLLQKIVVLGCVPAGALGMARLVRPVGSRHARLVSTLVYLALPLPYDALATGRWDALLAYAASPWVVGFLARASRFAPFGPLGADDAPPGAALSANGDGATGERATTDVTTAALRDVGPDLPVSVTADGAVASGHDGRRPRWRTTLAGQMLGLGVLEALLTSVAPSGALLVLVTATGLALGSIVTGGRGARRSAVRILATALGATAVAVVLLMPWSAALLAGPDRWQALTGLATGASSAPGWGAILRFSLGPIGDSPLSWAFLASAGLPLVIGSRWRLAWAGRAWVMALVAWVMAWAVGHDWLGPVTPSPQVLLAPAAVAVALGVGLGVVSFESDLPGYRFGWRQVATVMAAVAAAIAVLPVLFASSNGRWDLPLSGYGEATSWMSTHSRAGDFRVLWLGDPRVLPGGGWQLAPGLAYSISENGLGDATEMWPGSSPGAAAAIGAGVGRARRGSTVDLGRILAPYGIRYVVVVDNLAPSIPGFQSPLGFGPPADLDAALLAQLDLRQIIGQGGFEVFVDDAALPERAVLVRGQEPTPTVSPVGTDSALTGWRPILGAPPGATKATGRVPAGTVLVAVAPSRSWEMVERGGRVQRSERIFGYAASFDVAHPGTVTVRFRGSWVHGLEVAVEVVLWVAVGCLLVGRRRSLSRVWSRVRRRHGGRPRPAAAPEPEPVPGPTAGDAGAVSGTATDDAGVVTGAVPT
ncbi:MAG TPA: glycosyltransferase family 2 protein [Acidimicrobiales bacterium]|nr:glycosyltransferase family 2 protein [Acidimicrobiales bacterium]